MLKLLKLLLLKLLLLNKLFLNERIEYARSLLIASVADLVRSAGKSILMAMFNLPVAPVVQKKVSEPINLGEFEPRYEGWYIVVDLDTTLEANALISQVSDDTVGLKDRTVAMEAWLALMLVAWNFPDDDGNPLPQPRDGGVSKCRQDLIQPISQAIAQAINPKKS